ncbi:MAG: two-component response regulator [Thermomicrobiales bacterium]|nr:two-component response regulator [Thermomicrobiales bacterium]
MKTVLVVDDEPALRAVLRAVLDDEGYTVLEAPHGQAMLELLEQERPDLVLMDVMMSGGDGREAYRATRWVGLLDRCLRPQTLRSRPPDGAGGRSHRPAHGQPPRLIRPCSIVGRTPRMWGERREGRGSRPSSVPAVCALTDVRQDRGLAVRWLRCASASTAEKRTTRARPPSVHSARGASAPAWRAGAVCPPIH